MTRMLQRVQAMIRGEAPPPPVARLIGFGILEVEASRRLFEMETGP